MLKLRPPTTKQGPELKDDRRPVFGERRLPPPLKSAFVFGAEHDTGLKLYGGKKGTKPVPAKD
jgi:hypothetical protein